VAGVPLVRHAIGEPGAACRVRDRPARAVRRGQPQGRRCCRDHSPDHVQLCGPAGHDDVRGPGVHVDRCEARPGRRDRDLLAGHRDDEIGAGPRVEYDVERDAAAPDRRPRRAQRGRQPAVRGHRHHDEPGGDLVADRRPDRCRPVPGGGELVERRAEHAETAPAEEVRQGVLAPAESLLVAHPAVARQHLDHSGRQPQFLLVAAAHAGECGPCASDMTGDTISARTR
jgi:hypothetical protein